MLLYIRLFVFAIHIKIVLTFISLRDISKGIKVNQLLKGRI